MDIFIFFIIGVLVCLAIGFYLFLMIYFPEWVGITGRKTKQELLAEEERRKAAKETKIS